jgi:hypothetical protein
MIRLRDLVAKVRLEFDRDSTKKTEQDAKSSFDRIGGAAKRLGAVLAATFAISKLRDWGAEMVRTAMEAEESWSRLEGALRNAGVSFASVEKDIKAAAAAMQDLTTMGDEEFADTLTTLVQLSGDFEASMKRIQLVADLSAGAQMEYSQAAELVGRAMAGNTTQLERMFPALRGSKDVLSELAMVMEGQAARHADTLAGRVGQLSDAWGDFKEAVGNAMVQAGGGTSILDTLLGVVKALTGWVERNTTTIVAFARGGLMVATTAARVFWGAINAVAQVISGFLFTALSNGAQALSYLVDGYALATAAKAKFAGLFSRERQRELEAETRAIRAQARALRDWASAARETAAESFGSVFGSSPASGQSPGGTTTRTGSFSGGGSGGGGGGRSSSGARLGSLAGRAAVSGGSGGRLSAIGRDGVAAGAAARQLAMIMEMAEQIRAANADIESAASSAAQGVADAWEQAFTLMTQGFDNVDDAAVALGKGIAGSLLGGLADFAKSQVGLHIAAAFGAKAFAASSAFINPAMAATQAAAVKAHYLSAAKWAVVAGAAGAAQAAISGSGAPNGSRAGTQNVTGSAAGNARVAAPEIHVYYNPNDPENPTFVRTVYNASKLGLRMFGPMEQQNNPNRANTAYQYTTVIPGLG